MQMHFLYYYLALCSNNFNSRNKFTCAWMGEKRVKHRQRNKILQKCDQKVSTLGRCGKSNLSSNFTIFQLQLISRISLSQHQSFMSFQNKLASHLINSRIDKKKSCSWCSWQLKFIILNVASQSRNMFHCDCCSISNLGKIMKEKPL